MKKIALYLFIISVASTISFLSCKKEESCEGCINGVGGVVNTNHPPVAKAGADQTIILPTNTVNLDASGSTDPDNNITNYEWKKISGPSSYIFSNASALQTQATNLVQGVYEFELKVIDAGGLNDKDTVEVTVNPETNNSSVDIYVAGMQNDLPVYWKNGQAMAIDN
ncbi:MAG TPA: PKD domain-containing protein, partial [Chitinophagaceae bacterium]|nr:PKD domain-containing protein [Chitinophagaceae bacterium]